MTHQCELIKWLSRTDANHFESSLQFDSIYIRFEYKDALNGINFSTKRKKKEKKS
jgi:hypothetical protein